MKVSWRALISYGFVFWIILCITDYLGVTQIQQYSREFDELYEKPKVVKQIERHLEPHLNKIEYKGFKLGWSVLIWNIMTFVLSVFTCVIGQSCIGTFWTLYKNHKNLWLYSKAKSSELEISKMLTGLSKIPIKMKQIQERSSDTAIPKPVEAELDKLNMEQSCPNLLVQRNNSNLSTIPAGVTKASFRTILKRGLVPSEQENSSYKWQLENQCTRLKEELQRVQSNSLKEQAALTRKLNLANRAKKDLSERIVEMQKENRAAKQELENLIQEKVNLLRKLDNATKEFKTNTKTRKFALVKLEEMTSSVQELRQQLEQATRDKEILEKKLTLLDVEYNKLHERYLTLCENKVDRINKIDVPERDENNNKRICLVEKLNSDNMTDNCVPGAMQQTVSALVSVSQTEIDMRKIQEKIKQLEKNLENFNVDKSIEYEIDEDKFESEVSLSGLDQSTGSQNTLDGDSVTTLSGYSSTNSPKPKYWCDRVSEAFGKYKNLARFQTIAGRVQEKACLLDSFQTSNSNDISNENDTSDSDEREPKRLVSSSVAFQKFLQNLNGLKSVKRQIPGTEGNGIF